MKINLVLFSDKWYNLGVVFDLTASEGFKLDLKVAKVTVGISAHWGNGNGG